jgi:hypothetical protein
MPHTPPPHDTPETATDYFARLAIDLAQMECHCHLWRDEPGLLEPKRRHDLLHNMEMLTLHYRAIGEIANGRTLIDRIKGYRFLHTILLWTNGVIT